MEVVRLPRVTTVCRSLRCKLYKTADKGSSRPWRLVILACVSPSSPSVEALKSLIDTANILQQPFLDHEGQQLRPIGIPDKQLPDVCWFKSNTQLHRQARQGWISFSHSGRQTLGITPVLHMQAMEERLEGSQQRERKSPFAPSPSLKELIDNAPWWALLGTDEVITQILHGQCINEHFATLPAHVYLLCALKVRHAGCAGPQSHVKMMTILSNPVSCCNWCWASRWLATRNICTDTTTLS